MSWAVFGALLVGLAAALGVVLLAMRRMSRAAEAHITTCLKAAQEDFLTLATQRLATERVEQAGQLQTRKAEIDAVVKGLHDQLQKYERLIRDFEQDRATKYGSLEQQLKTTAAETIRLQQTTTQLTALLGNSKVRGQWGEKTADDILRLCGLQEGIHYEKQQTTAQGRPDFTFKLPDAHLFHMDVKFPLENFIRYVNSEREEEKRTYREQFLRDVRAHLTELTRRDYAPSATGMPDYVLMFIPNEQVYGAVNEWIPGLIDEALAKRIILCGPWTLYAQVRLIVQAWQSYYHAQSIGEIVKTVADFVGDYSRFQERFTELGDKLAVAQKKYREIVDTSYAQLDRRIDRIQQLRKEGRADEVITIQGDLAEPVPTKVE